jgi:hypothetical protein
MVLLGEHCGNGVGQISANPRIIVTCFVLIDAIQEIATFIVLWGAFAELLKQKTANRLLFHNEVITKMQEIREINWRRAKDQHQSK